MTVRGKRRLQIDQLYKAIATVEESLPVIVQSMIDDLLDPDKQFAMKDRIAAVRMMKDLAGMAPRVEDDLGLTRKEAKSESPTMLLLGSQGVSLLDFRSMDPDKRRALVLEALSGNLPEPTEVVVSNAD